MIEEISKGNIPECAKVIKDSFLTVATEFNITPQNAPRYVAFSTASEKLSEQYENGRKMFAYFDNDKISGFYSLEFYGGECELNNLCVLPEYRHKGVGGELIKHSFSEAEKHSAKKMRISIVEENSELKRWYENYGFVFTHSKNMTFSPSPADIWKRNCNAEYHF